MYMPLEEHSVAISCRSRQGVVVQNFKEFLLTDLSFGRPSTTVITDAFNPRHGRLERNCLKLEDAIHSLSLEDVNLNHIGSKFHERKTEL